MGHRRQEAICIGRKVHSRQRRLQIQHRADERRVLMGKAIVLLPRPCTGFDVVERADVMPPGSFVGHLDKLAVLDHHGLNDPEERFVRWEETCPARERVPLQHALTGVLRENLNNSASLGT